MPSEVGMKRDRGSCTLPSDSIDTSHHVHLKPKCERRKTSWTDSSHKRTKRWGLKESNRLDIPDIDM